MNMMNLERVKYNQQRLGLLLQYLKTLDYRFITISPSSHEKVNKRPENAIANDLAGIFGWNRVFKYCNNNPSRCSLYLTCSKVITFILKILTGNKLLISTLTYRITFAF